MSKTTTTERPTPATDSTQLARIGQLAIAAHRAACAWTSGRNGGTSYRGKDGMRDLEQAKGATALALREAIEPHLRGDK